MTAQTLFQDIKAGSGKITHGLHTIWTDLKNEGGAHPSPAGSMIFGPVPSRRLGRSLGVNYIPSKTCSYDCVYCQAGRTTSCSVSREFFANPYDVACLVQQRLGSLKEQAIPIDYISLIPNGEPTLDCCISKTIRLLRDSGCRIAVFTNASLLWNDRVKEDLMCAEYVSVKVDTVNEASWIKINRPHPRLQFDAITEGLVDFSRAYNGILTTETMFVNAMNDTLEEVRALGTFLARVKRERSYFAIPLRPPAEGYAIAPPPETLNFLSRSVTSTIAGSEMLCCPEGNDFEGPDDAGEALLGILAVHPMTTAAIESLLRKKEGTIARLQAMVEQHLLHPVEFRGTTFYVKTTSTQQPVEAMHHA